MNLLLPGDSDQTGDDWTEILPVLLLIIKLQG